MIKTLMNFSLFGFMILSSVFLLNNLFYISLMLILSTLCFFIFLHSQTTSHWFGFFLLLIYLGGILMILLYLASMTSSMSMKYKNVVFLLLVIIMISFSNISNNIDKYLSSPLYGNMALSQEYNVMILVTLLLFLASCMILFSKFLLFKNLPLRSL